MPAAVDSHAPDVVLVDRRMPRVDGITATRRLRARGRPPEVIVLTTFDSDENVLSAGASGFLLKDPPADISAAIRRVAAGEPMLAVHHSPPEGPGRRRGRRLRPGPYRHRRADTT